MGNKILVKLDGVAETMLIPLYFRAKASKQNQPKIMDTKAIELIDKIDYDFSKYSGIKMTHMGTLHYPLNQYTDLQK